MPPLAERLVGLRVAAGHHVAGRDQRKPPVGHSGDERGPRGAEPQRRRIRIGEVVAEGADQECRE